MLEGENLIIGGRYGGLVGVAAVKTWKACCKGVKGNISSTYFSAIMLYVTCEAPTKYDTPQNLVTPIRG